MRQICPDFSFCTGSRLFDKTYQIEVTKTAVFNAKYMHGRFGWLTGDIEQDKQRLNGYTTALRSTAGMAILFNKGNEIFFHRFDDLVECYCLIQKHISNWIVVAREPFSQPMPPKRDFLELDNFANSLAATAEQLMSVKDLDDMISGADGNPFTAFNDFTFTSRQEMYQKFKAKRSSANYESLLPQLFNFQYAWDEK